MSKAMGVESQKAQRNIATTALIGITAAGTGIGGVAITDSIFRRIAEKIDARNEERVFNRQKELYSNFANNRTSENWRIFENFDNAFERRSLENMYKPKLMRANKRVSAIVGTAAALIGGITGYFGLKELYV